MPIEDDFERMQFAAERGVRTGEFRTGIEDTGRGGRGMGDFIANMVYNGGPITKINALPGPKESVMLMLRSCVTSVVGVLALTETAPVADAAPMPLVSRKVVADDILATEEQLKRYHRFVHDNLLPRVLAEEVANIFRKFHSFGFTTFQETFNVLRIKTRTANQLYIHAVAKVFKSLPSWEICKFIEGDLVDEFSNVLEEAAIGMAVGIKLLQHMKENRRAIPVEAFEEAINLTECCTRMFEMYYDLGDFLKIVEDVQYTWGRVDIFVAGCSKPVRQIWINQKRWDWVAAQREILNALYPEVNADRKVRDDPFIFLHEEWEKTVDVLTVQAVEDGFDEEANRKREAVEELARQRLLSRVVPDRRPPSLPVPKRKTTVLADLELEPPLSTTIPGVRGGKNPVWPF